MSARLLLALGLLAGCVPLPGSPPDAGLRVLSLNLANGAGDRFRTAEVRALQAALLAGVELAALQEVDIGVERSGELNTALAAAGPGLEGCSFEVLTPPHLSPDGLLRCSNDAGTVLFGLGFRGDDVFSADDAGVPGGIIDGDTSLNPRSVDRGTNALFGNALVVRGARVESAVVVALPIASGQSLEGYQTLANLPVEERAAHNLSVRSSPGIEPRSVLVVRLPTLVVLVSHFEAGNQAALRATQLAATIAIAKGERRDGRRVVLVGDLNMSRDEASAALSPAGFVHLVGESIDQLWADDTVTASELDARETAGASDHQLAVTAVLR